MWVGHRNLERTGHLCHHGSSDLSPAQLLFSLFSFERHVYRGLNPGEPTGGADKRGIHLLQMDSRGIVEWASSELVGDIFLSRESCVDVPGNCYKMTQIIARPDSDEISMQVDIEKNRKRVLRQTFTFRRVSSLR